MNVVSSSMWSSTPQRKFHSRVLVSMKRRPPQNGTFSAKMPLFSIPEVTHPGGSHCVPTAQNCGYRKLCRTIANYIGSRVTSLHLQDSSSDCPQATGRPALGGRCSSITESYCHSTRDNETKLHSDDVDDASYLLQTVVVMMGEAQSTD